MTEEEAMKLFNLIAAQNRTPGLPEEMKTATIVGVCIGVALGHVDHEAGDVLLDMAEALGPAFEGPTRTGAEALAALIRPGLTRRLDA
jgi:hypothetical protein